MVDRGYQSLVKLVLEPEWESKFEANSYGFRPGHSCHDAIEAADIIINHKAKKTAYSWHLLSNRDNKNIHNIFRN